MTPIPALATLPSDMHAGDRGTSISLERRLVFLAFVLLFTGAFYDAYLTYLSPVWNYFGFTYEPLDSSRLAFGAILLISTALVQCPVLSSPQALVAFLLYANVYVPGLVTSLLLRTDALEAYGPFLLALSAVFVAVGLTLWRRAPTPVDQLPSEGLNRAFERFTSWAWLACMLALLGNYHSVMGFASLDDQAMVYEQRVSGTADSAVLGYLQTYFSNVFNPTLLLLGLLRRRYWMVLGGLAGGVTMYAITAQRTILLLPIILVLMYLLLNGRRSRHAAAEVILAVLAVAMLLSSQYQEVDLVAALFALLLTFRTIAIPGLTLSQYEDLFSQIGHTAWTHVKGIDLLISPPSYAHGDSLWPNLGYMVGDRTYNNPIFNVNANLFAGDGIAAAGAVGVLCIGVVFTGWLWLLGRVSRGWPPLFSTLALLPVGISLTNGNFFTTMLSFGGVFWLAVLHGAKPRARIV
ncbi:hypothetical protein [Roseateles sp.]|uniref:hypothetical protein n=1 Tax=Roseateles sp. TaxID=1971397 RepID=UPI00392C6470